MRRLALSAIAAWVLCAGTCAAEEKDPASADALFRAGRAAADAGDAETAYRRFSESYRLDPAVGTLLNVADSEVALGRLADASEHYQRLLDTLDATDDRIPLVKERLSALTPRVPKLELSLRSGSPDAVEILRDGVRLTPASFGVALPQNLGAHELMVSSPGRAPRRYALVLAEGEVRQLSVEPGAPEVPAASAPLASAGPGTPPPSSMHSRRALAHGLVGAGAVSAIATGLLGWRYAAESSTVREHCPSVHGCDDTGLRAASLADFLQVATIASGLTAATCLGGGLTLLWTEATGGASTKMARMGGVTWHTAF